MFVNAFLFFSTETSRHSAVCLSMLSPFSLFSLLEVFLLLYMDPRLC